MLRWSALLGVVLLVLLASGASAAGVAPDDYLGEWSADTSSAGPAAAQTFVVTTSDESTARSASGTNSINFDDYCNSSYPGVPPVTYFLVTTTGSGTFGGCVSGKTGGHIYTWNTGQVWYAHTATRQGEPVLNGTLVTSLDTHYAFRAHHPDVKFVAHVRFTQILKKGTQVAELTTITGAGELHIVQVPESCASADSPSVVSGAGALAVTSVKIGGPSVVELDSLTVRPDTDQVDSSSTFNCDHQELLRHVGVSVTKSDPAEKDACPVGASGFLWLVDGGSGGLDSVKLDIPKCHVDLVLHQSKAKKGSHVAIAEAIDENGY
jgi:hypothetical protein